MGCYDTFVGECPHCSNAFESQTKFFSDDLNTFKPGDRVSLNKNLNLYLQCKEVCHSCGKPVVAAIFHGDLATFIMPESVPPNELKIEIAYGQIIDYASAHLK